MIGTRRSTTTARIRNNSNRKTHQGMNFVRQDLRLAIYLRDSFRCVYCDTKAPVPVPMRIHGRVVLVGNRLSLDHVIPSEDMGADTSDNLVTACRDCNTRRKTRPVTKFAPAKVPVIRKALATPVTEYRAIAKQMIARKGSCAKVVAAVAR